MADEWWRVKWQFPFLVQIFYQRLGFISIQFSLVLHHLKGSGETTSTTYFTLGLTAFWGNSLESKRQTHPLFPGKFLMSIPFWHMIFSYRLFHISLIFFCWVKRMQEVVFCWATEELLICSDWYCSLIVVEREPSSSNAFPEKQWKGWC